jgi:hypothetical protein
MAWCLVKHRDNFTLPYNLYTSTNIIRVIKSRKILVGHVARMGAVGNVYSVFENLKGRENSEDRGVDGKIILEWILGKGIEILGSG